MSNAPALQPQLEYYLIVANGSDKGTSYRLQAMEVRLGRDTDNHISFPSDQRCSRHHAVIRFSVRGAEIQKLTTQNKLYVNGREVDGSPLTDGTKIRIGSTELIFQIKGPGANPLTQYTGGVPADPSRFDSAKDPVSFPTYRASTSSKTKFYVIVGGVLVLFIWLLSDDPKKKEETDIRSEEQMEADIEAARKLRQDLSKRQAETESRQSLEAESAYLKGFRDYRQGQYQRAVQSFQAALSLSPEHRLAKRYLVLSQRKSDEMVQHYMIEGRRYRDQNQYSLCKSSFQKVMTLLSDPNNRTYQESKELFDICDTLLRSNL